MTNKESTAKTKAEAGPPASRKDGPELEGSLQSGAMGMSYELADAHVADMRASIWTLTKATFTGAAILLREKAAYRDTSFRVQRGGLHAAGSMSERRRVGWVA
jgi:hypothetical protein